MSTSPYLTLPVRSEREAREQLAEDYDGRASYIEQSANALGVTPKQRARLLRSAEAMRSRARALRAQKETE